MDNVITVLTIIVSFLSQLTTCQLSDVQYEIDEESSNRIFGNIVEDTSLKTEFTPSELAQFTYSFLSPVPFNIHINEGNGDLSIVGRIDREQICPNEVTCSTELDIAVSKGDILKATRKINVIIVDQNDNIPIFSPSVYKLEIPESANVKRSFTGLPTAVDNDSPDNSIKSYKLLNNQNGTFSLKVSRTPAGLYDLKLVLEKKIDREIKDRYILKVNATDGSDRQGTLVVDVIVKDSNDHSPEFNSTNYETSIKENIEISKTILRVYAKDLDIGNNGKVVYKFQAATQNSYGQLFGINNITGAIFIKGLIDYEEASIYHLVVTAQDKGSDSIPVDVRVTIHVIDQNDCIPQITINTLTKSNTDVAEIPEDADKGSFVAQLLVSDADSGDNGKVTCTLNDNVFTLEEETPSIKYRIITASVLDRERHGVYNLAIVCKDKGTEPQTAIKQLKVDVLDANDHKPIFLKPSYLAEIYENNTVDKSVITVSAVDADIGPNAEVTYALSSDATDRFEINPLNGTIKTKVPLDRETEETIKFYVIAKDNGEKEKQKNSSVLVTVKLKDINDEVPRFDEPLYSFHITEESLPYTPVGVVYAKDPDAPPDNTVTYSIDSASKDYFSINPSTGQIISSVKLDREQQPVYYVIVTATDSGTPARSSTARINVILDDINDNKPVFKFPNQQNKTLQISNLHPVGGKIEKIIAVDLDSGTYGHVTYKLVDSVEADDFSLDALSGDLTLIKDLSLVDIKEYNLVLSASDQGNPPEEVFANLKVVVNKSISNPDEPSAILSKPNETAVIAVACVAAIIIVPLAIGIACICRHRNQLKTAKRQNWLKSLKSLAFPPNPKNQSGNKAVQSKKQLPVISTIDTDQMVHHDEKLIHRASSLQDSGIDNPGVLNMSWNSGLQFQDERDNSSAEGSNADSGRGPSEADDNHSHLHIQQTPSGGRPERPPKAAPIIGSHFDSPGRRLLYTKTNENYPGVHHTKQDCTRTHHLNRSFNSQKGSHTQNNFQRQYSHPPEERPVKGHGSYNNDLQRSDSYPDRPVQYIAGRCSNDVYV